MTGPAPRGGPQVVVVTGAGSGLGQVIAERLALAGHIVYAGMRSVASRSADRAATARSFATTHGVALLPLELDVLSDAGCRAAVDQVLSEQGRLDVMVNNAGMLMSGVAEAFTPEQFLTILDTNAVSWLRTARAALPVMRRQGAGTLVYVSSTTAHIVEPFMATYIASKAAGEAFAESMGFEVTQFGIDTVILVPGAFTQGTEHFAHTTGPAEPAVTAQYGDVAASVADIPRRLAAIDIAEQGHAADVDSVGDALIEVLGQPRGSRPHRVVVDAQRKGVEDIDAVRNERQRTFFTALDIDHLLDVPTGPEQHDQATPSSDPDHGDPRA
jgi:NAD(P)-dependent dehydrogenase (short-subunit alcohol dehydrogenase family)